MPAATWSRKYLFRLPKHISAQQAVWRIARLAAATTQEPRMTRGEMIALARVACLTEGIDFSIKPPELTNEL